MKNQRSSGQPQAAKLPIKAVFCDLGNVLVTFRNRTDWLFAIAAMKRPRWRSPGAAPAGKMILLHRLAQAGIIDATAEDEGRCWRLDTGAISIEQLHQAFIAAAEITRDQMPLYEFFGAYNNHHGIIPETCGLVRQIQAQGIALIAATNGDSPAACNLVELQAKFYFDGRAMSWQIGCKKPQRKFFQRCLALAEAATGERLEFSQCVLVDDIEHYVEEFRNLGGVGICFNATTQPASDLRNRFQELGLLPALAAPPPANEETS